MHQRQLVDEVTETIGQQYQERRMVEHLRGQIALIKGTELSTAAEMNAHDFDQKTETHGYRLEITEKEMRAKQYQYEAGVMREAMSTLEATMDGIHRKAKEEQQQLKDANLPLTEANKMLNRENLLRTPAFDGKGGAEIKTKIHELEENLQETEKECWETKSENTQTKAKLRQGYQPVGQTTKKVLV